MVKQLKLKLMLLLCALVVGSGSVWADSYTYDFSSGGSYNSSITPVTNTWTTNYFTILQEKGTSNTAVGNYLTSPRWYQNHIITITPAAGYTITKIVINCGSSSYTGQDISASTGTVTKSGNNSTWSGSVTSSTPLVLTMGKQCRPSSLNVTYTVPAGAVAAPNFSPTSGAVAAGTEVTLSQTTADEIRYTTDGTDPTITTGTVYSGAIIINTPTTIKAIAIKDDAVSDVASASYTINVEKPIFDVEAGEVDQGTLLTISVAEGCSIIYTIDGSTPSYANSIGELYDSPIAINNAMVVKAIAVDNYENESAVTSATYVINYAGGIDITPNYTFFGKTAQFSGNTNDVVTGTKDGITVTYTRNGSSLYASSTAMRFYKDNTLKIDAPAGKTITNVVFTQSNGQRDDMTSTPDGYNSTTKTWTGDATSVTFTRPSAADSYLQFTNIEVVLANKVTIASACTDGEMYYGTYSSSKAFKVPSDLVVSEIEVVGDKLSLSNYSTGDIVPANTGVLIASEEAGDYTISIATGGTSKLGNNNMLKASGDEGINATGMSTANSGCTFYRLTMHNGTDIGFWYGAEEGAAFDIAANKAYLAVPNSSQSQGGARMSFWFDGETTGISSMHNARSTKHNEIYNLNGQRISQPTKGMYIVNGKKVIK